MKYDKITLPRGLYISFLSSILKNFLKYDKIPEFSNLPERVDWTSLAWVFKLVEYYQSIVDFSNPLEVEKCGDLVIKYVSFVSAPELPSNRLYHYFDAFTVPPKSGRKYTKRDRRFFYMCPTLEVILSRGKGRIKNGGTDK